MSDQEIRRIFDEAAPTAPGLPRHREALRRELLRAHGGQGRRRPRRRWHLYLPVAAAAALTVVLILQSMPVTLASVLREMERAYAVEGPEGIHYVRQILEWDGEEEMETEQWWDPRGERFRMVSRSVRSGEILGHSISLGGEAFATEGSRFIARRMVRREDRAGEGPEEAAAAVASRMAVILRTGGGAGTSGEPGLQAILVGDLDRSLFSRRTPREILEGIHQEPGLEYLGTEIDDTGGAVHHVLRSEPSLQEPSAVLGFPSGSPEEVRELIASAGRGALGGEAPSGQGAAGPVQAILDGLASREAGGVQVEEARVLRTYRVDAATSRITRVTVTVTWGETGRYTVSKRILADRWVEDAPSLFDPELFGMRPVPPEALRGAPLQGEP